jgi:hypothetical protein
LSLFGVRPGYRIVSKLSFFVRDSVWMTKCPQKPILHVILIDRDQWAVEAEWPDGTLERINTFNDRSSATDWISTQAEAWLEARNFINE